MNERILALVLMLPSLALAGSIERLPIEAVRTRLVNAVNLFKSDLAKVEDAAARAELSARADEVLRLASAQNLSPAHIQAQLAAMQTMAISAGLNERQVRLIGAASWYAAEHLVAGGTRDWTLREAGDVTGKEGSTQAALERYLASGGVKREFRVRKPTLVSRRQREGGMTLLVGTVLVTVVGTLFSLVLAAGRSEELVDSLSRLCLTFGILGVGVVIMRWRQEREVRAPAPLRQRAQDPDSGD